MLAEVMDEPIRLGESLKRTLRVWTLELPHRISIGML